jgi:hypothetical protein
VPQCQTGPELPSIQASCRWVERPSSAYSDDLSQGILGQAEGDWIGPERMLVFWLVSKVCAIYYELQIKDLLLLLNPSLSAKSSSQAGFRLDFRKDFLLVMLARDSQLRVLVASTSSQ